MLPSKFLTPLGTHGSAAVRVILPQHKLDALGSLLGITFDSMGYPASPVNPASPVSPASPASPAKQAGAPKKPKKPKKRKKPKRKSRTLGNALQACKKRKGAQSTRCLRRAQLVKDL